jgi:hypothetical protein
MHRRVLGALLVTSVAVPPLGPALGTAIGSGISQRPSAQAPSALAPSGAAGTAAISGTIIDSATHRPLAGAIVGLRVDTMVPTARITRQITDETGRFLFQGLPASDSYAVYAAKFGYLDGSYGQPVMLGPTSHIALREGQWFGDATIVLWKPSSISGRVLDERAEPVVDAFVRVLLEQFVAGDTHLVAGPIAKTDDHGAYRISGLIPGPYLVVVPSVQDTVPVGRFGGPPPGPTTAQSLSGIPPMSRTDAALDFDGAARLVLGNYPTPPPPVDGRAQAYPTTFFPGTLSIATANRVDLGVAEDKQGIDVALQPVPTGRIAGTVIGPADAISGLTLRLVPAGLDDLGGGSEAATSLVTADGTFSFLNVPAGAYIIDSRQSVSELSLQTAPGATSLPRSPGTTSFGTSTSDSLPAAPAGTALATRTAGSGRADTYSARTPVTVNAGTVTDVDVVLHRAATMTGRVVFEGTAPVSAPRVPIYAEPANGSPTLGRLARIFSPQDAHPELFTIEGLQSGEYVLQAPFTPGYMVKSITMDGEDYTRRPFDTSRTQDLSGVVITLTDQVTRVTGFVRTDRGTTSEAAVMAFPVERQLWTHYGWSPARIKSSTVNGTTGYRLVNLPAGNYYLIAVEPSRFDAWHDPAFLEKASASATPVTIQWGETKTVDLRLSVVK